MKYKIFMSDGVERAQAEKSDATEEQVKELLCGYIIAKWNLRHGSPSSWSWDEYVFTKDGRTTTIVIDWEKNEETDED